MDIEERRAKLIEDQRLASDAIKGLLELGFSQDSPEVKRERDNLKSVALALVNLNREEHGLCKVHSLDAVPAQRIWTH